MQQEYPRFFARFYDIIFRLKWDECNGFKQANREVPLHYYFRYELEHLVVRSRFSHNYRIFGDFQKNDLTNNSKNLVVECYK